MHYWQHFRFWLVSVALHAVLIGALLWQFGPCTTLSVVPHRLIVQAYVIHTPTSQSTTPTHDTPLLGNTAQQHAQHTTAHAHSTPSSHRPSTHNAQLKHLLLALSHLIAQHLPSVAHSHSGKLIKISFILTPDGTLHTPHVIQSSGNTNLDHTLLQSIEQLPTAALAQLSKSLRYPIHIVAPIKL